MSQNTEKPSDSEIKSLQAQLDICTWVLIALMRKHKYKQFSVGRKLLTSIAQANLELFGDDESDPENLIIIIQNKDATNAEANSGNGDGANSDPNGDRAVETISIEVGDDTVDSSPSEPEPVLADPTDD